MKNVFDEVLRGPSFGISFVFLMVFSFIPELFFGSETAQYSRIDIDLIKSQNLEKCHKCSNRVDSLFSIRIIQFYDYW